MKQLFRYEHEGFVLLSVNELSTETQNSFMGIIINSNKKKNKQVNPLGGRAEIIIKNFTDTGMVVFKNYFRGGMISFFNKRYYLKCKDEKRRPLQEILFILELREMGIPVPEPVATYYKGKHIYRGGIISKYIKSSFTLAEFSKKEPEKAEFIFTNKFMPVYKKIIVKNIHHPDLHPGNVLISNDEDIVLIDFDKACYFDESRDELMKKMDKRWNRAVTKHKLPHFLSIQR